jgi:hypothetical protein
MLFTVKYQHFDVRWDKSPPRGESKRSASRTRTKGECLNKANLSGIRHFTRSDFRLLRYFELTRGQLGDSEKRKCHEMLVTGKNTHTERRIAHHAAATVSGYQIARQLKNSCHGISKS